MSENTPSGEPTPDNVPEPAPAADESSTPPPPPPSVPEPAAAPEPPAYQAAPPPAPAPAYAAAPAAGAKNSQATWSLVSGIVSLFCCGIVLGIVAIVLGNNGKKIAAQTGVGEGQAKAGVILGIIGIVLNVVYGAFYFSR